MIDKSKLSKLYRLKNLIRYNTRTRIKDESVAEHSYYVTLFSLIICNKLNINSEITFKCLIKSILHDLPEIETNDITHDAKIHMNLFNLLKKYEEEYYKKEFPEFEKIMTSSDLLVDTIVNIADTESVCQYIQNEKLLGNNSPEILEIEIEANKRLMNLEKKLIEENLL